MVQTMGFHCEVAGYIGTFKVVVIILGNGYTDETIHDLT